VVLNRYVGFLLDKDYRACDQEDAWTFSASDVFDVQLMALSETDEAWLWQNKDEYDGDEWYLPFDITHWREDATLVNVILVEFHDGIAYREGIGQVHIDAWNLVKQPECEIVFG
jgi:hypothetical protein